MRARAVTVAHPLRHALSRIALVAALAAALGGCESLPGAKRKKAESAEEGSGGMSSARREVSEGVGAAARTTSEGIGGAVRQPLRDLNLEREKIPEPLNAIDYVYETAPPPDCVMLAKEIAQLDEVLGRDYDKEEIARSTGEKGGEAAGEAFLDIVADAATGWIPYRGLVREATGAAGAQRKRAKAYAAGYARRAYLKGLGAAQACPHPAAPAVLQKEPEEPEANIESREVRRAPERRWGPPQPAAAPPPPSGLKR